MEEGIRSHNLLTSARFHGQMFFISVAPGIRQDNDMLRIGKPNRSDRIGHEKPNRFRLIAGQMGCRFAAGVAGYAR